MRGMWRLNPPDVRRMQDFFESIPSLGLDLLFAPDISRGLKTLLMRVDLFNAWWVVLVAMGCQRLLGLRRGTAVTMAVVIWAVTSGVSAFWASLGP